MGEPLFVSFAGTSERPFAVEEAGIGFVYRPIWDCSRQVVLTYLCQPVPPRQVRDAPGLCIARCGEDDARRLDITVLREALAHGVALQRSGFRLLIACPVHFSTLAVSKSWNRYSQVLMDAPPALLRDIGFLLVGMDEGVPAPRIAQEIPKLTQASRHVLAVLPSAEEDMGKFANTGVRAVGIEVRRGKAEREAIPELTMVATQARRKGMETFALGMRSTSLALNAAASGTRFLEGKAVCPPVKEPRYAFVHGLEHLYQPSLAPQRIANAES
jgi:hypothetical protein